MVENVRNQLLVIVAVALICVAVLLPTFFKEDLPSWWPGRPMRLGLDLRGGASLVLRVVTEDAVKSQLTAMAAGIRAELKANDLPVVRARQVDTREVEVTLLNDRKLDDARSAIHRDYPNLQEVETKREGGRVILRYNISEAQAEQIKKDAVQQAIEVIRNRVDQHGVVEPAIQRLGEDLVSVQMPSVTNIDEVKKSIGKVAKLEFRLVAERDADASKADVRSFKQKEGGTILLEDEVLMTGDAIKSARVDISQTAGVEVSLEFTSSGTKTFANVTSEHIGRRLAIVLDEIVQSAPNIKDAITQGRASITGSYTDKEAHQLAVVLRSGALPAELKVDSENIVGASLGTDAITRGFTSLIVGSLAVIVFVLFYYRKSGRLAVVALCFNILVLMSCLASLGATLTLPGMAGLVLTVAMALDANVIIFERIKEEIRNGSSVTAAIQAGFANAHWTVMDSNITTFMVGLLLYVFGTGPVRGFAVTLCLGILTSLFTALFVARILFKVMPVQKQNGELSI